MPVLFKLEGEKDEDASTLDELLIDMDQEENKELRQHLSNIPAGQHYNAGDFVVIAVSTEATVDAGT